MPISNATQAVMERLKQGRVISIASAPAKRLADVRALILLSQTIYWTVRDKSVLTANGWLSKPAAEWLAETGLSRSHLASAITTLREQGVLKTWQKAKLAPWWKVDLQGLYALCHGQPTGATVPLARFCTEQSFRDQMLGKPLPYYALLTEAVGDALAAFFLSRCVYWQELLEQRNRLAGSKPSWGWSSTDWTADIGISRSQLRTAMSHLAERGLIVVTEIGRPFPGVHVDMGRLGAALEAKCMPYIRQGEQEAASGSIGGVHTTGSSSTVWENYPLCGPTKTKQCTPFKSSTVWSFCTSCTHSSPPFPPSSIAGFDQPTADPIAVSSQSSAGFDQSIAGFSQSTRACGFDYSDYTETTTTTPTPSVNSESGNVVVVDLIYPPGLSDAIHLAMAPHIAAALPHRRQALLDELAGRLATNIPPVRNAASYLRGLVMRDLEAKGKLLLDYADAVREKRKRQAAISQRVAAASAAPPHGVDAVIPPARSTKDFSALRAALKGQPTSQGASQ